MIPQRYISQMLHSKMFLCHIVPITVKSVYEKCLSTYELLVTVSESILMSWETESFEIF